MQVPVFAERQEEPVGIGRSTKAEHILGGIVPVEHFLQHQGQRSLTLPAVIGVGVHPE
ncbi:hypothetical protein D3C81_2176250 [compost metagenome]